ncbi:MAG: inorganic phosphate transporter [Deltaproteobacteria bacterium]|nr:inorganic phosphate transporter [Deltaproteobacteria bacterium]
MSILGLALFAVALALFFDFSNGFHDASNIVATIVSSRSMGVRSALILTALLEFTGAYFLGTAVAKTIGHSLIIPGSITINVVIAATISAILWNLFTWFYGLPSSSSHALIGGLIGATCMASGWEVIHWGKLAEVIGVILVSPLIGFICGFILTNINFYIFSNVRPSHANMILKRLQILSSAFLALAHGTNDAQKSMGLITLSLVILYPLDPSSISRFYTPEASGVFIVPKWVIIACAFAIALGMLSGGKRIIRTIGLRLYKIRPVHGFSAQTSCAAVVYICALLGFPVSTTHIATSTITGAGTAQRINIVRWGIAGEIAIAWIVTIPASCIMGMITLFLVDRYIPLL